MTQRILVTGGTGLLGSYILRWLLQKGYTNLTGTYQSANPFIPFYLKDSIEWKRLRLPDIPDAYDVIAGKDWVIHSAALVSYFKEDKFRILEVNKEGTEHIVNACLEHNVKHLVYVSSIGSLGKDSDRLTLNETNGWVQTKYSTTYSLSKYLGELEIWRGAGEGLNVSAVLPSVILGTGDWQRSSLQILDRVAKGVPFYPGGQTGYVDVRDIAKFIVILLEKNITGERWILNGANIPYKKLYERIAGHLSIKRNFKEAPQWLAKTVLLASNLKSGRFSMPEIIHQVYGTFNYDSSKSKSVEGFEYTPFDETLRDVAKAYKEGKECKPLPM